MIQKTLTYTFHCWEFFCQGAFVRGTFVLDPDYSYINFHKSFPNNIKMILGGGRDEIDCLIF